MLCVDISRNYFGLETGNSTIFVVVACARRNGSSYEELTDKAPVADAHAQMRKPVVPHDGFWTKFKENRRQVHVKWT